MVSVYLETSFFSECVTIRTAVIELGRREAGLNWWQNWAQALELCVSPEVARELSSPDFPEVVRSAALAMLEKIEVLEFTSDVPI